MPGDGRFKWQKIKEVFIGDDRDNSGDHKPNSYGGEEEEAKGTDLKKRTTEGRDSGLEDRRNSGKIKTVTAR